MAALNEFEFAVFVLLPEDHTTIRDDEQVTVRDNVIFELGLFLGRLGRERIFFITPKKEAKTLSASKPARNSKVYLPSDLSGITPSTYDPASINLQASVGNALLEAKEAIRRINEPKGPMADLIGLWDCTWVVEDDRHRESHKIKDRLEFTRIRGEDILAAGRNTKHGNYTLIGRGTPSGVLTFYYRGDVKRHFSGGVIVMKLDINSRLIMTGVWFEFDADRQFYGGSAVWKKAKVRH